MTSAVGGSLGRAYVELHGDYSKLAPEAEKAIKSEIEKAARKADFDALGDKAEKAGRTAGSRFGEGFSRDVNGKLRDARGRFVKEFDHLGADILGKGRGRGGLLGGIKSLFSEGADAVKSGLSTLSDAFGKVQNAFSSIASGGGDVASLIKVTAILAAVPAVFALAGALVHLSGALLALPAAGAVAVAGISTLVVAFQGFGEAIGAGFSGDAEKFRESLKGLAEPAQTVVKEIIALKSAFSTIKKDTQSAFFAPLIGIFKLLGKTLLPEIRFGMQDVADAFGNLFAKILTLFTENDIFKDVGKIFDSTGRIIRGLTDPITELFAVMFGVIKHGLPFVERFFKFVGEGLTKFTNFLSGSLKSGSFERFLENAADIGGRLFKLLKSLGPLIASIFGGQNVEQSSGDFIDKITESVNELTKFFNSPDGKQAIEGFLTTVKGLGLALVALAIFTGKAIHWTDLFVRALASAVEWALKFLQAIGGGFVAGLKAIGGFFEDVGSAIANFFTVTIPNAFNAVVTFFQELPGRIQAYLTTLFLGIVSFIGEQIGKIIGIILALPYLISTLPQRVSAIFDSVVSFISALGPKALDAITNFGGSVLTFFTNLWDNVSNIAQRGIDSVVNFIGSLPSRLAALGPLLLNAAKGLGRKIGEGFSEIGNFASDIGKKIVSSVKSGINFIIDSINRGISSIDDEIPVSLPRLPHLAKGAVVSDPTLALVGEAGPEVVVPLSDPNRARQLADESGLSAILNQASSTPVVNVTAILDGIGMLQVIKTIVDTSFHQQGQELAFGAR